MTPHLPAAAAAMFSQIREHCRAFGLDLAAATAVQHYNDSVGADYCLPDFGRSNTLAIVVGNTRTLWPHLLNAIEEGLDAGSHPVDTYCARVLRSAVANIPCAVDLRFAHDLPPRRVAMQRLAYIAGLAYLSPSYLCVHPIYGPWIALRAALVLDVPGPEQANALMPPPCVCERHCSAPMKRAMASHSAAMQKPSGDGVSPVAAQTDMATSEPMLATERDHALDAMHAHWQRWLAVRDACPVGRKYRYSENQIRYHYTKERRYLR